MTLKQPLTLINLVFGAINTAKLVRILRGGTFDFGLRDSRFSIVK
jgi:hypothetical protein